MSASDLIEFVQQLRLDVDAMGDARVREVVGKVLNLVESVVVENHRLLDENQRLREIIRQLKGEPPSAAAPSRSPKGDVSSEKERKQRPPPSGGSPRADHRSFRDIRVDEEIVCAVDPASLPPDATSHWLRRRGCAGSSNSEPQHPLPVGNLGFAFAGTDARRTAARGDRRVWPGTEGFAGLAEVRGRDQPAAGPRVRGALRRCDLARQRIEYRTGRGGVISRREGGDFPGGVGGDDLPAHRRYLRPRGR